MNRRLLALVTVAFLGTGACGPLTTDSLDDKPPSVLTTEEIESTEAPLSADDSLKQHLPEGIRIILDKASERNHPCYPRAIESVKAWAYEKVLGTLPLARAYEMMDHLTALEQGP
jgi:hypothetical protein